MLIDNKGRFFGKINVIDFIVILLVIAAVGGIGYKFTKSSTTASGKADNVYLEFWTDEAPTFAAEKVKKGDIVLDTERISNFGKVEYVTTGKSVSYGQVSTGEFIVTSKPGLSSVYMQVYGQGVINPEGGVNINNITYYIGRTITLKAGNSTFMGRIYNLSKRG